MGMRPLRGPAAGRAAERAAAHPHRAAGVRRAGRGHGHLGGLVGFAALGAFIDEGFAPEQTTASCSPAPCSWPLLAIVTELVFGVAQRALTPGPARRRRAADRSRSLRADIVPEYALIDGPRQRKDGQMRRMQRLFALMAMLRRGRRVRRRRRRRGAAEPSDGPGDHDRRPGLRRVGDPRRDLQAGPRGRRLHGRSRSSAASATSSWRPSRRATSTSRPSTPRRCSSSSTATRARRPATSTRPPSSSRATSTTSSWSRSRPSDAVDTNAFVVTQETADELGLETLSDLAENGADLTLGGPADCATNPFCIPGLQTVYGVDLSDDFSRSKPAPSPTRSTPARSTSASSSRPTPASPTNELGAARGRPGHAGRRQRRAGRHRRAVRGRRRGSRRPPERDQRRRSRPRTSPS